MENADLNNNSWALFDTLHVVHFIPILTTIISILFLAVLMRRFVTQRRLRGPGSGNHLLWWAGGIFTYGCGTALEAAVTLHGNTPLLNQLWYVFGAILGGYPLAQGSVYLHFSKRTANLLTIGTVPVILLTSIFVFLSPIRMELLELHRPGGAALEWQWVRLLTPIINGYAVVFLIGSAIVSSYRFAATRVNGGRALGNALIAFGALLPGIGGGMAKGGYVEALYIGEFVGLLFIWAGYVACVRAPLVSQASEALPPQDASHSPAHS